jgi:hypothetical protein
MFSTAMKLFITLVVCILRRMCLSMFNILTSNDQCIYYTHGKKRIQLNQKLIIKCGRYLRKIKLFRPRRWIAES